jgi:hypothetical protein
MPPCAGCMHAAMRCITVGEGGGFGPLQDEIAGLLLCMGGLGVSSASLGGFWGSRVAAILLCVPNAFEIP